MSQSLFNTRKHVSQDWEESTNCYSNLAAVKKSPKPNTLQLNQLGQHYSKLPLIGALQHRTTRSIVLDAHWTIM